MPNMIVTSFNIEKNGQSSSIVKNAKVDSFIDLSVRDLGADVVFLCEVHSARIYDYCNHLRDVYHNTHTADIAPGGHSNAYVIMTKEANQSGLFYDTLKGLNRAILVYILDNKFHLALAHFKSGQTGLTKNQLQNAASALDGFSNGCWAITGDMNWDYAKFNQLTLPANCTATTCWTDSTQKSGGILDWCLSGHAVTVHAPDAKSLFPSELQNMNGPDHRPVVFSIDY